MYRFIPILVTLGFLLTASTAKGQNYIYSFAHESIEKQEDGTYTDDYGTCYVQTLLLDPYPKILKVRDQYSSSMDEGIKPSIEEYGNLRFTIAPASLGWIKKRADKNCVSANPDDCLIWCRVELEERIMNLEIIDESKLTLMPPVSDRIVYMMEKMGHVIYSESDCELSDESVAAVRKKLIELGYMKEESKTDLLFHIQEYQYENRLPIGGYNLETLEALGVE